MHTATERMEMELLYSRALDMNGGVDYSDEDGENSIYKQKYERAMKELEFTKRRLQQQHEDDLEQLMGLKKQLEKKARISAFCLFNLRLVQTCGKNRCELCVANQWK